MERKGIQSDCHYMHLIRAYKSWNSEAYSSAVRSLPEVAGAWLERPPPMV